MTTAQLNRKYEREVMEALRESRVVSVWWLGDKQGRARAFKRLEDRGRISSTVATYPNWRVTIHRAARCNAHVHRKMTAMGMQGCWRCGKSLSKEQ